MRRCSAGAATTVAPPGMGSASESWPMSCISAAYSRSSSSASLMPSSRRRPATAIGDPAGVAGLGVAAELGDAGQGPDGLQVDSRIAGVAAERELGEQQRHDEHRQCPEVHDRRGQSDQRAGGADGRADADLGPHLVAQHGRERGAVGSGPDRRGEHRVDDEQWRGRRRHETSASAASRQAVDAFVQHRSRGRSPAATPTLSSGGPGCRRRRRPATACGATPTSIATTTTATTCRAP